MGKCTKIRCPMQAGTVDENCDIKDCPYRTEKSMLDIVEEVLIRRLGAMIDGGAMMSMSEYVNSSACEKDDIIRKCIKEVVSVFAELKKL